MTVEYLTAGRAPRPHLRRALSAVVIGVVVIACALAWLNDRVKNDANASLSAALSNAQQRATDGEATVLSTLSYTYPMIWSTMVSADVRAGLRRVVQASAAEVVTSLTAIRAEASGTLVLPWQSAQREARDSVLALLDAQLGRFSQIATDATAIGPVLAETAPSGAEAASLLRASGAKDTTAR